MNRASMNISGPLETLPRRKFLQLTAGLGGASMLVSMAASSTMAYAHNLGQPLAQGEMSTAKRRNGRIRQSVSRWTYAEFSIEELCLLLQSLQVPALDLVGPQDWPILKKYGIDCSMCNGAELNIKDGWCNAEFHEELVRRYLNHIDLVAEAGYKNLICFSGNARGMDKQTALKHAVSGLRRIISHAEQRGVVLHMELLNSKVDHLDYIADNSAWGVELCKQLGSDHFKLLFDIYHMQIMEGDIIRSIQENHQFFGHYHTAGVPGRHEIDDSQELFYPAIVKAIIHTGFKGYLAHEFIPTTTDQAGQVKVLDQAFTLCDV